MTEYIIAGLALCGFALSAYIFYAKRNQQQLVCPVGGSCNEVLYSSYARTLGIPNEMVGIVYYMFIVAAYGIIGEKLLPIAPQTIPWIAGVSVLFSLYLVAIQMLVLRKWCEWCLTSTAISLSIFALILL